MIKISVIIPTLNRCNYLKKALSSMANQVLARDEYEVIVVDNGSTDLTKDVCSSFQDEIKNLSYIYNSAPGLHIGRHEGMLKSRSDILVFADDDIEVTESWLHSILNSFISSESVALVGGKVLPRFEAEAPLWLNKMWAKNINGEQVLSYLSIVYLGEEIKEISPYLVFGCNFAIRKSVLEKAQGFHPDGFPAKLLCYRGDGETFVSNYILNNNLKTIYHPGAAVWHAVPKERMTLDYFKSIAFRMGVSEAFTELRETRLSSSVSIKRISILRRVRTLFHWMFPFFEIRKIEHQLFLEKTKGRNFLILRAKGDKNLQEWILRPNYLDENGFIPS